MVALGAGVAGAGADLEDTTELVRTCTVVSSRKAVVRPSGSVPYHPSVAARGRVRCNLWRTEAGGISGACSGSPSEGRGLKDAKRPRESVIP